MELEEMKTLWDTMSKDIEKQKILTDKLIIQMTEQQYSNRLGKVSTPEIAGTFICFAAALFILINFYKLETVLQIICGIIVISFLLIAPVFSLRFINKMKKVDISKNNYQQTLIDYSKGKKQFLHLQKISFYFSPLLMLIILPVASKIINNKDFILEIQKSPEIIFSVFFAFVFLFFFSKWVFKHYNKNIDEAEGILKGLEN